MPVVLQLQNAHKRYGEQALLDGATCALADDQKAGLIGRNGAGKSTLCRVLLGDEELDAGEVVRSRKLRLGYLRQHDPFHDQETVLDFLLRDSGQGAGTKHGKDQAGKTGETPDEMSRGNHGDQPPRVGSGHAGPGAAASPTLHGPRGGLCAWDCGATASPPGRDGRWSGIGQRPQGTGRVRLPGG